MNVTGVWFGKRLRLGGTLLSSEGVFGIKDKFKRVRGHAVPSPDFLFHENKMGVYAV